MPENAVYVGRPTVYGNPFQPYKRPCGCWDLRDDNGVTNYAECMCLYRSSGLPRSEAVESAVRMFFLDLTYWLGGRISMQNGLAEAIAELRGKDLACWCPLDQPCHADVLLAIANSAEADHG